MAIVQLQAITYEIGNRKLFSVDHLSIDQGDRIGLVGVNGSGKTTLLEMIHGLREPSEGSITRQATTELIPQLKDQVSTLSGGEISQSVIREVFSHPFDLLLADEPTTHLDINHIDWLKSLFKRIETFVVISHDRDFLDSFCTHIWEIDEQSIHVYKGNYSDYKQQKELEILQHEKDYEKYIKKKKQLETAMQTKEQKAQRATRTPKKISASEAGSLGAKPYFAKKQKKLHQGVKSIQSRIDQLEQVDKPFEAKPLKMNLPYHKELKNRIIIRGEQISGWIGGRKLWDPIDFLIRSGDKIALMGPNGSGKTTFLNKLVGCEEGIQFVPSVQIGYFSQMLEGLNTEASILENVMSTSYQDETTTRIVLGRLGFKRDTVLKSVHVLSGGERVKVSLAKLFVSESNVIILDEPTNYLDLQAMEALEVLLSEYEGTILMASHDRRLLEKVGTRIFEFTGSELRVFDGSFKAYQYAQQVKKAHEPHEDELLAVETKISEVLSRLSLENNSELESEFQQLLKQKKMLENQLNRS